MLGGQIFGLPLGLLFLVGTSSPTTAFAIGGKPGGLVLQPHARAPVALPTTPLRARQQPGKTRPTAILFSLGAGGQSTRALGFLGRRGGAAKAAAAATATKGGMDSLTLLSTAMGYLVIAGSMLFKVPQAVRIFRKKSAEGLSASMYILESAGIAMSLAFSMKNAFPFSTYGEAVFILLQNLAIMGGISLYSDTPRPPVLILAVLLASAAFAYAVSPSAPMLLVSVLQTISIPLLNLSRIPQLILNHKNKSTGELAPSTLILQAAGNLARIFTTMVQVQNNLFLLSCLVAMVFNGALVAQYFMYRDGAKQA